MSRTPYDRLAKATITAALESAGEVKAHVETQAPAVYVDLVFEPDSARLHELERFGWLRRIAGAGPVLFEFFHNPPDVEKVRTCIIKHGLWLEKIGKTDKPPPRLWIISAGRPLTAMRYFGFRRDRAWSRGVYSLKAGWPGASLVVVNELPTVRETLLLRVLGRDKVLARALRELAALPVGSAETLVLDYKLVRSLRANTNMTEKLMTTYLERAERRKKQWQREGQLELLKKQLKFKFPKATASVLAGLEGATSRQIVKWSERVLFAGSLDEVFR